MRTEEDFLSQVLGFTHFWCMFLQFLSDEWVRTNGHLQTWLLRHKQHCLSHPCIMATTWWGDRWCYNCLQWSCRPSRSRLQRHPGLDRPPRALYREREYKSVWGHPWDSDEVKSTLSRPKVRCSDCSESCDSWWEEKQTPCLIYFHPENKIAEYWGHHDLYRGQRSCKRKAQSWCWRGI